MRKDISVYLNKMEPWREYKRIIESSTSDIVNHSFDSHKFQIIGQGMQVPARLWVNKKHFPLGTNLRKIFKVENLSRFPSMGREATIFRYKNYIVKYCFPVRIETKYSGIQQVFTSPIEQASALNHFGILSQELNINFVTPVLATHNILVTKLIADAAPLYWIAKFVNNDESIPDALNAAKIIEYRKNSEFKNYLNEIVIPTEYEKLSKVKFELEDAINKKSFTRVYSVTRPDISHPHNTLIKWADLEKIYFEREKKDNEICKKLWIVELIDNPIFI